MAASKKLVSLLLVPLLMSLLLLPTPSFLLVSADSTATGAEGASPSTCEAKQVEAVAQCEDKVSKLSSELSHLKSINEESVKACNLVSEQQVVALTECQKAQEQLGSQFNEVQNEKLELQAKMTAISRETLEREGLNVRKHEEEKKEMERQMEEKQMEIETYKQKVQELVKQRAAQGEELERQGKEGEEKMKTEFSRQLEDANQKLAGLRQDAEKKETEIRKLREEKEESVKKIKVEKEESAASCRKETSNMEKEKKKHQDELKAAKTKLQEMDNTPSFFYSYDQFVRNAQSVRSLFSSLFHLLCSKLPPTWSRDSLYDYYVQQRMSFIDPTLAKLSPHMEKVSEVVKRQGSAASSVYFGRVHPAVVKQLERAKTLTSPYVEKLQAKTEEMNEKLTMSVVRNLEETHPELKQIIPVTVKDRIMFIFFLFVFCSVMLHLALKSARWTAFPVLQFVLCRVVLCGLCKRRGEDRSASKRSGVSKKKSSSSSSSRAADPSRKKPEGTSGTRTGMRTFKADEHSSTPQASPSNKGL